MFINFITLNFKACLKPLNYGELKFVLDHE